MGILRTIGEVADESASLVKNYAEEEFEHAKLKAFYQVATLSVGISKKLIIGLFLVIFLMFSSISQALYLGELVHSLALGFLITSGIYLFFGFLVFLVRRRIEKYVVNKLSEIYFDS